MKQEVKEAVKYLKSINVDGGTINLDRDLYTSLEEAYDFIHGSDHAYQVLELDKLDEIGMGFEYFRIMGDGDGTLTVTVDTSEAIEDILYGIYLTQWFKDHQEGEPASFLEFRDNDYYILGGESQ